MKKPYIFFDFDGTLLDTNDLIVDSWKAAAMHYLGEEFSTEYWERTFGEPIRYTASVAFPGIDVEEAITVYRDWQAAHVDNRLQLFDGCYELLSELKARGYKLAIVTSRMRMTTSAYLDRFDITKFFDVIIDHDSTSAHKPDPEPLLVAISAMSKAVGKEINLSECIMLGDTRFDMLCCKNAGIDSVLVGWSHAVDEEQLKELGALPVYRIAKPMDLLEVV